MSHKWVWWSVGIVLAVLFIAQFSLVLRLTIAAPATARSDSACEIKAEMLRVYEALTRYKKWAYEAAIASASTAMRVEVKRAEIELKVAEARRDMICLGVSSKSPHFEFSIKMEKVRVYWESVSLGFSPSDPTLKEFAEADTSLDGLASEYFKK